MVGKLASSLKEVVEKRPLQKAVKSATSRALDYVGNASRIQLQDLRDNPGARTASRQVVAGSANQAGHTIGELQHAAKPPLGWVWGDFYKPWQRMFPGEERFNGDINLRREYVPLSLIELQRMIDLNWLDTSRLIDICALSSTKLVRVNPEWRQFGVHLTDEGSDIFCAPINIEVQWASLIAIAAIEKAGGRVRTAYYDLESMKAAIDAEAWFRAGRPIPRRKFPPHSLMNYYGDADYRGYLADPAAIEKSRKKLAEIEGYTLTSSLQKAETSTLEASEEVGHMKSEEKRPEQVFLGLEPGQLVSLEDRKVFEPTHPALEAYYRTDEPLADYLR